MNLISGPGDTADIDCMLRFLRRSTGSTRSRDEEAGGMNGFSTMAQALYRERRRRAHYFHDDLFAEPAWDMLLDLRVQADARGDPSMSSTCIASAISASTAYKHLKKLERAGLVVCLPDPSDRRRKFARLTDQAAQLMDTYLAELALDRAAALPQ